MRIQLVAILVLSLISMAHATDSQEIHDLMENYDKVTKNHQVELVDDVFTEKFLKDNDGKEEFIEKVKSLPIVAQTRAPKPKFQWKQGLKGLFIFAKLKLKKDKAKPSREGEFILVRENGKLKIDGTLSDG